MRNFSLIDVAITAAIIGIMLAIIVPVLIDSVNYRKSPYDRDKDLRMINECMKINQNAITPENYKQVMSDCADQVTSSYTS